MLKLILCASALVILTPAFLQAQIQSARGAPTGSASETLRIAKQHLKNGESCLSRGDTDCARREFDSAVDVFLESGVDLRTNVDLLAGWRELIETISRYETASSSAEGARLWKQQEFEGRPQIEVELAKTEPFGQLDSGQFQAKFAELRKRFTEKYGRDITLTGADHPEHRRLYGTRSAYDIRVRDLTREQVSFIISTGRGLGLRIKDFSTWESVAAHNARSRILGRPADTFATGVHLHIDRMAISAPNKMIAKPVLKSKRTGEAGK
jgi:hypothetical protein